jgi:hypothetical protein
MSGARRLQMAGSRRERFRESFFVTETVEKILNEYPEYLDGLLWLESQLFISALSSCFFRLFDPRLYRLSKDNPKAFDQALDQIFSRMKMHTKAFYGVTAHRPPVNYARDVKIWKLQQEHLDWTPAQIGRKLHLRRDIVRPALLRQQRRLRKREDAIRGFFEFMRAVIRDFPQRAGQELEEKPLLTAGHLLN